MKLESRQLLRWTFLAPVIGVTVMSPIVYNGNGLLGEPHLTDFATIAAILYLFGIPAALITAVAFQWLTQRIHLVIWRNLAVVLIGAMVWAYPICVFLTLEVLKGTFSIELLVTVQLPMTIGMTSTLGMLALESWRDRRRVFQGA